MAQNFCLCRLEEEAGQFSTLPAKPQNIFAAFFFLSIVSENNWS